MNDRDDLDLRVRDFVADLPARAPDDTLDRVLAELPVLPQHGRLRTALRRTLMQTSARGTRASYALPLAAAAAVIVVFVAGALLLSRGPSANVGTGAVPTMTASPSGGSSPSPDGGAAPSLTPRGVDSTPFDVPRPFALDVTDQAVWATSAGGVVRIDLPTGETRRIEMPGNGATGIVTTAAAVWVAGYPASNLYRIDPDTDEVSTIALDAAAKAVGLLGDEVVVTLDGGTAVVDPVTGEVDRSFDVQAYPAFESLWTIGSAVYRHDPTDGSVIATIELPPLVDACQMSPLSGVDGAADLLVIGCFDRQLLTVIDATANEVVGTYDVGTNGGTAIAIDGGWWSPVGPVEDGGFARMDPDTGEVLDLVDLGDGNGPSGMDTTSTDLWIVSEPNEQVVRIPLSEFGSE